MNFAAILTLFLFSTNAFAQAIQFSKEECIKTNLSKVYSSALSYDSVQNADFSKYKLAIPGFSEQVLLEVSQSRSKNMSQTESGRVDLVQIVMRPWDMNNSALYPKFVLECVVVGNAQSQFQQNCNMRKDLTHFGLTEFKSAVHSSSVSEKCGAGSVLLKYQITLVPEASQIAAIQKEITGNGPLSLIVGKMFSNQFFKLYYENYYAGWRSSLQP